MSGYQGASVLQVCHRYPVHVRDIQSIRCILMTQSLVTKDTLDIEDTSGYPDIHTRYWISIQDILDILDIPDMAYRISRISITYTNHFRPFECKVYQKYPGYPISILDIQDIQDTRTCMCIKDIQDIHDIHNIQIIALSTKYYVTILDKKVYPGYPQHINHSVKHQVLCKYPGYPG